MKKYLALPVILTITAISLQAQSIEYFLETAFRESPVLKQQMHREKASYNSYMKESILNRNPVLSFAYSNVPVVEWPALNSHAMSGISIGVSQYVATPWEDTYRKEKQYKKYISEKEAMEEARNLLAFQVQSLYHSIMFLSKKEEILNKNKDVLKNILKIAESLVSVNKMNSSHLLKLKADLSVLSSKITELQGAIHIEHARMEKLCGRKIEWSITGELTAKWITKKEISEITDKFIVKDHPLYKKIKALYDTQEASHNLEIARTIPGATLGLEYRIRREIPGKDTGDDFISFKVSTPLPLYYAFKDRHGINAEEEKENELKEILRSIEIDLLSKWEGTSKRYGMLIKAYSSFEKEVLPGYWSAYEAQIGALSSGTVTLLDVLDAYRLYLNASLENARIYRDLMIDRLKLNYLLHKYPAKKQDNRS